MPRYRDDDDDDDDHPRRYDDDEDDDRHRRLRDEAARAKTLGPMIGLIVAAVVGIAGNVGWTALNFAAATPPPPNIPANQRAGYDAGFAVGAACPAVGGLVVGLLTVLGGVGVRSGNRGMATAGIIAGFIPCHLGWVLSLAFGIWGLVVLNDPDVIRAYRR